MGGVVWRVFDTSHSTRRGRDEGGFGLGTQKGVFQRFKLGGGGPGVKLFLIINFNIILNQCQINIFIKDVVSKFCGNKRDFYQGPFHLGCKEHNWERHQIEHKLNHFFKLFITKSYKIPVNTLSYDIFVICKHIYVLVKEDFC